MIVIRQKTMTEMERVALESFEERMLLHLKEFFPKHCEQMGKKELSEFIHNGIQQARSYDIIRECDVAKFIDLMVALNPDFHDDLQKPWIHGLLTNRAMSSGKKLDMIFRRTMVEREQKSTGRI